MQVKYQDDIRKVMSKRRPKGVGEATLGVTGSCPVHVRLSPQLSPGARILSLYFANWISVCYRAMVYVKKTARMSTGERSSNGGHSQLTNWQGENRREGC